MTRACVALAVAAAAGCSPRVAEPHFTFWHDMVPEGGGPPIRVEFSVADRDVVEDVLAAVRLAYPKATRWGAFRTEVRVRLYPTHESLEAELGRRLDWLRAWATYDSVLLQSPRTWGGDWWGGDGKERLEELLAHELTHVAVYQLVSTRTTWETADLPLWFREGLASWTAEQGYRRGTPAAVGAELRAHAGVDPLFSPEPMLADRKDLVYATAHWAFADLVDKHGPAGVSRILDGVARGLDFDAAFRAVAGTDARTFGLRWRARVERLGAAPLEGTAGD